MKSLKLISPHQICIEEDFPDMRPNENQLVIKIKRVSLCGSDIKLYNGTYGGPSSYPIIFGHEWSGEVIAISDTEKDFKVGDYVTGDCSRWCGECENCKVDKNLCQHIEKFGITIDGYARQIVIAEKQYIYQSKNKICHKVLALTEPFAVALHALYSAQINLLPKDAKILIIGCGVIGIAAYLFLIYKFGFHDIYFVEKNVDRLNKVHRIFSDSNFQEFQESNDNKRYQDLYSKQGFDYIFDASGMVAGLDFALEHINPFGRISYIGMTTGNLKNTKLITIKKITVQGSIGGTGHFEETIQFLEIYQELVSKLITYEKFYNKAEAVFQVMENCKSHIKGQIIFDY